MNDESTPKGAPETFGRVTDKDTATRRRYLPDLSWLDTLDEPADFGWLDRLDADEVRP